MRTIRLQSFEGEVFDTDVRTAKCCGTIKVMLEDCGIEETDDTVVPLPNVSAPILRKVLEWAEYHKDDPIPTEEEIQEKRLDDITGWDHAYLKGYDQSSLYELILAANYLNAKGLLELACKTVARQMIGKTAEQIRKEFNLKNDFTPEEEARIRLENEWCEENTSHRTDSPFDERSNPQWTFN